MPGKNCGVLRNRSSLSVAVAGRPENLADACRRGVDGCFHTSGLARVDHDGYNMYPREIAEVRYESLCS
ncbi:hypothetical protein NM962_07115 [Mycobacterium sp. SVM_VP21]|nr:hypothetical protein NM962_07115 [Mycobacterium sp. SVM_VP21]